MLPSSRPLSNLQHRLSSPPSRRRLLGRAAAGAALTSGLALSFPALAASPELAAEQGAGLASRGDLDSMAAIATAPGILHLRPRFDVAGSFALGTGLSRSWQLAAVDSETGPVALGVLFSRASELDEPRSEDLPGWTVAGTEIGEQREVRQRLGGAVSTSVLDRTLGLGMSAAWLYRKDGFDRTEGAVGLGASVGAHVARQLVISVTGDNLIPTGLWFAPTTLAPALRFDANDVAALQGDLILDFTSLESQVAIGARVGAEFTVGGMVPLRVGWARFGALEENRLTAGIGVGNDQAAFDYGFQASMDDGPFEQLHGVSLRIRL